MVNLSSVMLALDKIKLMIMTVLCNPDDNCKQVCRRTSWRLCVIANTALPCVFMFFTFSTVMLPLAANNDCLMLIIVILSLSDSGP